MPSTHNTLAHDHRHIVLTARGLAAPPRTAEAVSAWLDRLVAAVGMKVLMGPYATRCETPGNEGCTGVVVIETSHASVHIWDRVPEPFAKIDLYSCRTFGSDKVLRLVEEFRPTAVEWLVLDRNADAELIEGGRLEPSP